MLVFVGSVQLEHGKACQLGQAFNLRLFLRILWQMPHAVCSQMVHLARLVQILSKVLDNALVLNGVRLREKEGEQKGEALYLLVLEGKGKQLTTCL